MITQEQIFPGDVAAVRAARLYVRQVLADAGVPGSVVADAALAVSELAGNAVAHTASGRGGRFKACVAVTSTHVHVEVIDEGAVAGVRPRVRRAAATDEHGRGLALLQELGQLTESPAGPGRRMTVSLALAPVPCGHYGRVSGLCAATPTRPYLIGPRCAAHAP